jgi:hypothetical protein
MISPGRRRRQSKPAVIPIVDVAVDDEVALATGGLAIVLHLAGGDPDVMIEEALSVQATLVDNLVKAAPGRNPADMAALARDAVSNALAFARTLPPAGHC